MQRPGKEKFNDVEGAFLCIENGFESNLQSRQRIRSEQVEEDCPFSLEEDSNELSLTEELMLISLGHQNASSLFSSLNDNLPNVLRCCIIFELGLKRRIGVNVGNTIESPLKLPLEIQNPAPTGDQFLDEALLILQQHSSGLFPLQKWIEMLTGEVWDRKLAPCQLYQLRERVCKTLQEKRLVDVLVFRSFLIIEQVSYPIRDVQLHRRLCYRLIDTATGKIPLQLSNLLLLLSVKAAGILPTMLRVTDAPTSSAVKSSCTLLLNRFQSPQQLQQLCPLLPAPHLYLLSGVIEYFSKINSIF